MPSKQYFDIRQGYGPSTNTANRWVFGKKMSRMFVFLNNFAPMETLQIEITIIKHWLVNQQASSIWLVSSGYIVCNSFTATDSGWCQRSLLTGSEWVNAPPHFAPLRNGVHWRQLPLLAQLLHQNTLFDERRSAFIYSQACLLLCVLLHICSQGRTFLTCWFRCYINAIIFWPAEVQLVTPWLYKQHGEPLTL